MSYPRDEDATKACSDDFLFVEWEKETNLFYLPDPPIKLEKLHSFRHKMITGIIQE